MNFYDILPLPSEGRFYKDKIDKVKVEYLTTEDQLLLTSPNIINLGEVIPYILKNKLDIINYEDLLVQDIDAILFYLRELAIGNKIYYTLNGQEQEINFETINYNDLIIHPDENGFYKVNVDDIIFTYSPLTYKDYKNFLKFKTENNHDTLYYSYIIKKIERDGQIIESVPNILNFISKLSRMVYVNIKKQINLHLKFGWDLSSNIKYEEQDINLKIKIDEFFFNCSLDNYLEYRTLIIKEINILVTDGNYGYNDILKMPSHHRKENIDALIKNIEAKNKETGSKN